MVSYIGKRGGSANFYARLLVPDDLVEIIGRREYRKSLGTANPREAKAKGATIIGGWQAEFNELRRYRTKSVEAAPWEFYRSELELDEAARRALPSKEEIERERLKAMEAIEALAPDELASGVATLAAALDYGVTRDAGKRERERRQAHERALREHLRDGETALVEWAADAFISRNCLLIEKDSPAYRDLCRLLMRAQLEALERGKERDRGDYHGTPRDPAIKPPEADGAPKLAAPGETIMELFARFKRERFASAKPDTWNQAERDIAIFAGFVGPASHISALTRKAVRDWKTGLLVYPVRASDTKVFDGLSFKEIIAANATVGKPTLSDHTVNRMLSALSKFCNWLRANEFLEANPVDGHHLEIDKRARQGAAVFDRRTERDLRVAALQRMRRRRRGTQCRRRQDPGLALTGFPSSRFYSGARLGEITQLAIDDVRIDRGVWFLHITDEGDGERDKSVINGRFGARGANPSRIDQARLLAS